MRTRTSRLVWHDVSPRWHTAMGTRGIYTVRHLGGGSWGLFGRGHDGLTMISIPVSGALFQSCEAAKGRADELERQGPEGEMSGS